MTTKAYKTYYTSQFYIGFILLLSIFLISYLISNNNFSDAAIWLAASGLGFALQKSRFCFASSFRDLFLFGSGQNMKGVIIAIIIASIGFVGILSWILPSPLPGEYPSSAHILPVGLSTIIAGTLFGIGMVTAGGCVSGTIYRIAEGYVASVVTMLLGLYVLVIYIESRSGITEFKINKKEKLIPKTFLEKINENLVNIFSNSWSAKTGGVAIGFIGIIYFLFHSPPGVTGEIMKQSMSFSESVNLSEGALKGISSLSGCLGASVGQGLKSHTFVSSVGVFYGALVSALMAKEFKIRTPNNYKRYIQSLGGGVMMGFSASRGIGCTIGAFFSAISSLSLSGWVFGISLFGGAFIGTKIIKAIG